MLDFLTRGPLMEEAGDAGGGGAAVMESSGDFGESGGELSGSESSGSDLASTDGQVHDAEFVDPGVEPSPGTAVVKAGERFMERGRPTSSGRAVLEALAPLGSVTQQKVLKALFYSDYFMGEFPGGKKDVAALRALNQKYGGENGIAELSSIKDQMEHIDELYRASDPEFLDMITSDEEGKRSFAGLLGPALLKFSQLAPREFAYHNAVSFAHYLDLERVPVAFGRMADLLNRAAEYQRRGNHEMAASLITEIATTHNQLADSLDKVYAASRNPPEAQSTRAVPDDRTRQLDEREQALQRQEWETAVGTERRRIFAKNFAEVTKGRDLTSDQDSAIKGFYELAMNAKLKAWQNNAPRFLANSDRDGYLREQFGFFQKAIPEALRQAVQRAMPGKPGPKASSTTSTGTTVPRGTTPPKDGAIRVARMPATGEIDVVRTTPGMLTSNQAYLKTGKLVQWA